MSRPYGEEVPDNYKPPPPEPPPMREMRGSVETAESKRRTQEWKDRNGYPPPTTEIRPCREPDSGPTLAQVLKWFHLLSVLFWVAMIYPTIVYWSESVPYLVFLSIYTIIVDHAGAWATARIERNTEKEKQNG